MKRFLNVGLPALLGLSFFASLMPQSTARARERIEGTSNSITVCKLGEVGPWEIRESDKPVLRYNYQIIPEPVEVKKQVAADNRKYAVDRCDYIHPLYGLHGEVLTEDWPKDHPHHRGIYWAWPEVDWQGKRGDLHALQEVFARPTGKIRAMEGPHFGQIEAENQWCWGGKTPIVREEARLRAWQQTEMGRAIDLEFRSTNMRLSLVNTYLFHPSPHPPGAPP